MPDTIDILPFPMTAFELSEKLEKIFTAYPPACEYRLKYDPEFDRLYLARPEGH